MDGRTGFKVFIKYSHIFFLDCDIDNSTGYAKLLGGVPNEDTNDLLNSEAEDLGPITTKHLLSWAYQIAKGMEYLGTMKVTINEFVLFCSRYDTLCLVLAS